MNKYWKAFILALSSTMQYRANLVLWLIVAWSQPITSLIIWFTLAGARGEVGGYTKGEFLIYYLAMTLTWYLVGGVFAGRLGSDIKYGVINKTLVMPYNLILDAAVKEQAWKVVSLTMSLPIVMFILIFGRGLINFELTGGEIIMLIGTLVLGALIFALLEAIVGLSAFWFVEVWPIAETVGVLRMLFGGVLAPISLLPQVVQQLSSILPFRYMFYPSVSLLTGIAVHPLRDLLIQIIYIFALYLILRILWQKGLKRYEGIGG